MSYGVYSEIYLAKHYKDDTLIKIGETTNARRRNGQLSQNGYTITIVLDVDGGETERLFIESFLRARIEADGRTHRSGKDYFQCDCKDTADYFCNHFQSMVKEAETILNCIHSKIPVQLIKGYKEPIIPTGEEEFYNNIIDQCKKYGEYYYKWQCKDTVAYDMLIQVKKVLEPCGYTCQLGYNWSWKTLIVKKPFTY